MASESPYDRHGQPLLDTRQQRQVYTLQHGFRETVFLAAHKTLGEWRRWREVLEETGITDPFDLSGRKSTGAGANLWPLTNPDITEDIFEQMGIRPRLDFATAGVPDVFRVQIFDSIRATFGPFADPGTTNFELKINDASLFETTTDPKVAIAALETFINTLDGVEAKGNLDLLTLEVFGEKLQKVEETDPDVPLRETELFYNFLPSIYDPEDLADEIFGTFTTIPDLDIDDKFLVTFHLPNEEAVQLEFDTETWTIFWHLRDVIFGLRSSPARAELLAPNRELADGRGDIG